MSSAPFVLTRWTVLRPGQLRIERTVVSRFLNSSGHEASAAERIKLRRWSRLTFYSPAESLPELRKLELKIAKMDLPDKVKALRTNELRRHRELRQASLFCYGIGKAKLGTEVFVAPIEEEDYDCIAMWSLGGRKRYCPVQLKELVPDRINPKATLVDEIAKLSKYTNSRDLVVVMYLNRRLRPVDLSAVDIPPLDLGGLYLFGSVSPDRSKWVILGDLLKPSAQRFDFEYPQGHHQ
jgi:hypothetical protein